MLFKDPVNTNPFELVRTKKEEQELEKKLLAECRRTGKAFLSREDADMDFSRVDDPKNKTKK